MDSGRESEFGMANTADRVLSNLRDLTHGIDNIIDNIDAAIIHMLAERFHRTYRGGA
jgi:chorismate mutase